MSKHEPAGDSATLKELLRELLGQIDPALARLGPEKIAELLAQVQHPTEPVSPQAGNGLRWQDKMIEQRIPAGASVLDLGCGDGQLLARLASTKQVRGQGIELDAEAVFQCVERGVAVFQSDLDAGLKGFADHSFDYVVLEETLQTLRRPTEMLREMLRVGRLGIVSFPNFGYWRVRLDLAIRGRMPVTSWLPYRWFDTPNIHLLCLQDFLDWAQEEHVRIVEDHVLTDGHVRPMQPQDNLYAEEVLLVVERAQ